MKNKIDSVFSLAIFCFFAGAVLLVIMLCAATYANINEISREGQNERVLLSYIRTKIRTTDDAGAISVGEFHGNSALFLEENLGGREFLTAIYLYDGVVRELFHERGDEFSPADGVQIIRANFLNFSEAENGLIQICTGNGEFFILPRSR
jgi:hypothetical protein